MIEYDLYRFTNCAAYINPDAERSLDKVKRKVYLLYPTLEPFSEKDRAEILRFLATISEAFDGKGE